MIEQGDNVIVDVKETEYNTSKRKLKKKIGVFLKDYGNYIQIMDNLGLRQSIMKSDIIKIKKCK